jgi:hypothetical protein
MACGGGTPRATDASASAGTLKNQQDVHRRVLGETQELSRNDAASIARAIAEWCGREKRCHKGWKANCPICDRHSLTVTTGNSVPVLIRCWHCQASGSNDGWSKQRARFVKEGLLPKSAVPFKRVSPEEQAAAINARRIRAAVSWQQLHPLPTESHAANYLRARGLECFIGHPALRSFPYKFAHPAVDRLDSCWPILAARIWHVNRGFSGYQLTYLSNDKPDRARELDPQCRITHGVLKGGAVWIGAPSADEEIVVGEGLETLLSAMLLLERRCGAAVLGPDLKDLVLPSAVRRIHIAADNDETGRAGAACAASMWRKQGLSVRMSLPEGQGADFNNVLLRRQA